MIDKNRITNDLKRLVAVPSISGTADEVNGAFIMEQLLYEIPYFSWNRKNVQLIPLEGDPLRRKLITAYLECCPESNQVVILTGHYDVVGVEEFGHLQKEAFNIDLITHRINEMPLDEEARKDYDSGEWYFGRGTADMKFGHALCLELLRHYAEENSLQGNLLYVGVCGEETNSEGMLRAVPFLNDFKKIHDIEYTALLLAECYMVENQADDSIRYIHYGAEGKVMPMFFFAGASTHSEEPFLGLDPLLLSNEVYRRIQLNSDLCGSAHGELGQTPVCLKSLDLKPTYSGSTPLYAAAYYNLVTFDLNPQKLISQLVSIAEDSFDAALQFSESKTEAYELKYGVKPSSYCTKPVVKTYAQISAEAKASNGVEFEQSVEHLIQEEIQAGTEMQDIAIKIVKKTYEALPQKQPMIVVSFIPPFYPDNYGNLQEPKTAALLSCVQDVINYAQDSFHEKLELKNYYCVSDLSYTQLNNTMDYNALFENLAGANQIYTLPIEDMQEFFVPSIVLGGYGKDLHKHTERLHKHYNFDVLPYLYVRLIDGLLG